MINKIDSGAILDAASRRWQISKAMKCQPETQALLLVLTDAASAVWVAQYRSNKARRNK